MELEKPKYTSHRPVTQARFVIDSSNKCSPDSSKILQEDISDWDDQRPLTINHTKTSYNRISHQPTCYGQFRGPIKVTGKPGLYPQCTVAKKPNVPRLNAYGAITAELFFPSSTLVRNQKNPPAMAKPSVFNPNAYCGESSPLAVPIPQGNMWQKFHRRVTTSECGRPFRQCPKSLLPLLRAKDKAGIKEESRPCTGKPEGKVVAVMKTDKRASKAAVVGIRVGTAQTTQRPKLVENHQQKAIRVSTPQTITEKRPESRYNKETLYAKLEHGRASSPEYEVPVLDMRFSEVIGQQIIPECWK